MKTCFNRAFNLFSVLTFAVLSFVLTGTLQAQEVHLQVGDRIPAFRLKDQKGNEQTLASLSGPNGLLLLFNRSADWCPLCKSQIIDLENSKRTFEAKGIHLAVISYDAAPILKAFSERKNITFPLLSDFDSKTIDGFGVRNREAEAVGVKAGLAVPNYFLVTRDGTIRLRINEAETTDRVTANYIYESVYGPGTAAQAAVLPETPHVKVSLSQSNTSSAPGAKVRLAVHFDLAKDEHLYAPGAETNGYRPIKLTIEPSDLYQSGKPIYGKATILEFADLKEKVPVFTGSTVLIEDVWAVRSPKTNAEFREHPNLTIQGTLEYQVCTSKTCFPPQSKPVSWSLTARPDDLDTTRVAAELQRKPQ